MGIECLKWLGVNGFEFVFNGKKILLDPYVTRSLVEVCDKKAVDKYIDGADYIFMGHSHWDHLADAPEIANRTGAKLIGSKTTLNICRAMQVPEEQLVLASPRETFNFDGFSVEFIPSLHKKPMLYPGYYTKVPKSMETIEDFLEGGTSALLFDFDGTTFLNLGSANFIAAELKGMECDYLLLGIPRRSDTFTRELLDCVKCKNIIPTHFDYFDTPIENVGERVSLDDFRSEVELYAPDVSIIIPESMQKLPI
ncbi:MAG: MBL fold metallo-hydrolase [Lentisphaerae bacterium]|nr:MBL fold metallo-hydrolase [Lentisphaerota bacterium]MCP4102512.1 MBL fold metallo-hydrolase [Lentisphaerota bacterium]